MAQPTTETAPCKAPHNVRAKVTKPVTIYGEPRKPGSDVMVDRYTFSNLVKKGRLEPFGN